MKIVHAVQSANSTMIKQTVEQLKDGHDLHFMTRIDRYHGFFTRVKSVSFYSSWDHYKEQLNGTNLQDIDLIHAHMLPAHLGIFAKEARPDVPVVLDCPDLNSMRVPGHYCEEEVQAIEMCDGFVFCSRGYFDNVDTLGKPKALVYQMVNKLLRPLADFAPIDAIVYEGMVGYDEAELGEENPFMDYRDYRKLASLLQENGIGFFLFTPDGRYGKDYTDRDTIVMKPLVQEELFDMLARFTWGYCGAQRPDCPQWNTTVPNKFWEYITAGVPVIVYGADETAEWVEKYNLGVVVKDLDDVARIFRDIPRNSTRYQAIRRSVETKRHMFTAETQKQALYDLYDEVLTNFYQKAVAV